MTMRPCIAPGCPALTRQRRCTHHQQAYERQRGTSTDRGYDSAYRRLRAEAIRRQPWCSVCMATTDLSADHIVPLTQGGTNTLDNLQVLCKPHNTAKGGRAP